MNSVEIMQADEQNLLDDVFVISRKIKLILTSGTSDIAKMESNNCFYDIPVNCCEKQYQTHCRVEHSLMTLLYVFASR